MLMLIHQRPSKQDIEDYSTQIEAWFLEHPDRVSAVVQFPWGGTKELGKGQSQQQLTEEYYPKEAS